MGTIYSNRSRKVVARRPLKSNKYNRGANSQMSLDDEFDAPMLKESKKHRLQSAKTNKLSRQIDEIQEEGYHDTINLTVKSGKLDDDAEESQQLLDHYRKKFTAKSQYGKSRGHAKSYINMHIRPQSVRAGGGGYDSVSKLSRKTIQPIFNTDDLQEQLNAIKKKCNSYKEENVTLNTQNKALKKEIKANEKVIELMLNNNGSGGAQAPGQSGLNHYSLLIQCKRKLREALSENNNLNICIGQMRKDMRNTKEAVLMRENQELRVNNQTTQFTVKRLNEYISDLKDKLKRETDRATMVAESKDEDRLRYQVKEYEKMTMNMDRKMKDLERKNDSLEKEISRYQVKVDDIRKKHDNKETKLRLELNKKEHNVDHNQISRLKQALDAQKLELKQANKLVETIQPRMNALLKEKQRLVSERDQLNQALIGTTKEVKAQLKAKNKEIVRIQDEADARNKSLVTKHRKDMAAQENKLMNVLGANKHLDSALLAKQTDISAESKLKVKVR